MDPKVIETIASWKDPLGYPWSTYLWVVFIACMAGVVKYLNGPQSLNAGKLFVKAVTASFMGVVAFWLCETRDIHGPMSAVLIAIAGAMGDRCWTELENIWRIKFGLKKSEDEASE